MTTPLFLDCGWLYSTISRNKKQGVKKMDLKQLRVAKKVTQTEVAKVIGVSVQMYNFIENKKRTPCIKTVVRLSKYFNCSTDEIIKLIKY